MTDFEKAVQYVRENKTWSEYREKEALDYISEMRCDINHADHDICEDIADLMEEYGEENGLPEGWWLDYGDENDIFLKL